MRVVFICCNDNLARPALESLRAIGARFYLICEPSSAYIRHSRACERLVWVSKSIAAESPERLLDIINGLVASDDIELVVSADVEPLMHIARIRDRLRVPVFPMADYDTLATLNNKWAFHRLCVASGVGVPKTRYFANKRLIDPEEIARDFEFPVVVKPAQESGGLGFTPIEDKAGLEAKVLGNRDYDYAGLLVQEYVDGFEVGLSVFARAGAITNWTMFKLRPDGIIEFFARPDLLEAGERLVADTNFTGIADFDVFVDRKTDSLKFLECNPRCFLRMRATRVCGLDFLRAGLPDLPGPRPKQRLDAGCYIELNNLLSLDGWKWILTGQWPLRALIRILRDRFADPLPTLIIRYEMIVRALRARRSARTALRLPRTVA